MAGEDSDDEPDVADDSEAVDGSLESPRSDDDGETESDPAATTDEENGAAANEPERADRPSEDAAEAAGAADAPTPAAAPDGDESTANTGKDDAAGDPGAVDSTERGGTGDGDRDDGEDDSSAASVPTGNAGAAGESDRGDTDGRGETDAADGTGETVDAEPANWEKWFDHESRSVDADASDTDAGSASAENDAETAVADVTDSFGSSGILSSQKAPEEDQEMPLTAHVEEMLKRLAVVIAIAGVVSLLTFPFADRLINTIWYGILPGTDVARPRVYGILSLLFTRIKVASLAGVIVALPVLVYQTYQFMRPGLYPHERRYYLAAIPTSLVLAIVGVSFAYFIVLPAIFTYFLYYSESVATIGFALMKTFDLILLLMGYLAVVFQIPLFIMLAMMMGLVTRRWLADRRLIFWGAFLGISFLFSPDPTGMAPIIVALTMVGLFEGTLLVARWAGR